MEIGVEPYLITATCQAVIAQRLVRKICVHCREEYQPTEEALMELGLTPDDVKGRTFYGCSRYPKCDFATWDKPIPTRCAKCGAPFLVLKRSRVKGEIEKCLRCGAETEHE